MKKLVVLLSAFLIFAVFTSSPVLAARPTFEHRMALLALFCRNAFQFTGVFMVPVEPEEITAIDSGIWGPMVGGDADDYADGRVRPPDEAKPSNKLLGVIAGGEQKGIAPSK